MTPTEGADAHVVDLAQCFPDASERQTLLAWGADYLSGSDEDATIRSASLALEVYTLLRARNRRRHRALTPWQCRLSSIAFVTAAVRLRQLNQEASTNVRH